LARCSIGKVQITPENLGEMGVCLATTAHGDFGHGMLGLNRQILRPTQAHFHKVMLGGRVQIPRNSARFLTTPTGLASAMIRIG
jgi:hypothetical protein